MSIDWIVVEVMAILIENLAYIYFLNSRFDSKDSTQGSQIIVWLTLVCWGLIATFFNLPVYDIVLYFIMLMYIIISKYGTLVQKIFGVLIVGAMSAGTSIVGAGLASFLMSTTIEHTLIYQDTSRLIAIVFIKMIQVIVFYVLAKKHHSIRNLQKSSAIVLCIAAIIDFVFLIMIRAYIEIPDLSAQQSHFLVWLAIGSLLIMVTIFLMYEMFVREESMNVELAIKLQRLEMETQFFKEIDAMYTDMRKWRHDYKNNLIALRALVEHREIEKLLKYVDNILCEPSKNHVTLQTGNLVLDAVVSSKLWLAQSQNIEVSIQAVYIENNGIEDNDLCAITGNLLDNAIEACERMSENNHKKFINFTLMFKGKSLFITISNSYNNELRRSGERYFTVKKEKYHGMGIIHVDSIVNKYRGHVLRSQKHGIFETHVMLPLLSIDGGK